MYVLFHVENACQQQCFRALLNRSWRRRICCTLCQSLLRTEKCSVREPCLYVCVSLFVLLYTCLISSCVYSGLYALLLFYIYIFLTVPFHRQIISACTRPTFTTFSRWIDACMETIDLSFVFRSQKGCCCGEQV